MSIAKYRTPLGTAIDEDLSIVLPIGYDTTLLSFQFFIVDNFLGTVNQIGTVTIIHRPDNNDSINLTINHSAWNTNFSPVNEYSYFIQQVDSTGFISDVYSGSLYLNEIGHPYTDLKAINMQNVVLKEIQSVYTSSLEIEECPNGTINGINTLFQTTYNYVAGTTQLYKNGLKLKKGTDYTETYPLTITFTNPPLNSGGLTDSIIVTYIKEI